MKSSSGFDVFTDKANIYKSQPFNFPFNFPYRPYRPYLYIVSGIAWAKFALRSVYWIRMLKLSYLFWKIFSDSILLRFDVKETLLELRQRWRNLANRSFITVCTLMKNRTVFPKLSLPFKRFCSLICGERDLLVWEKGHYSLYFYASRAAITFSRPGSRPRYSRVWPKREPACATMKLQLLKLLFNNCYPNLYQISPDAAQVLSNLVPRVSLLCLPWSLEERP